MLNSSLPNKTKLWGLLLLLPLPLVLILRLRRSFSLENVLLNPLDIDDNDDGFLESEGLLCGSGACAGSRLGEGDNDTLLLDCLLGCNLGAGASEREVMGSGFGSAFGSEGVEVEFEDGIPYSRHLL